MSDQTEDFPVTTVQSAGYHRKDLVRIRTWKPGDGIACVWTHKAKRTPCGPPVAVTLTEVRENCWRDRCSEGCDSCVKTKRRIVCRNHIPGLYDSAQLNIEARKAAGERLVVAHWAEYQQYIDDETEARRREAFERADPEIRRIVLAATESEGEATSDA